MSEIKLKPCPFCGSEAWTFHVPENNEYEMKLHEWIWRTPGRWLVGCDTQMCMLNINNMPETFASEQEAAEAWNTRAEQPSAQPERLTDKEQRIFLAAMGREEKVCKQVDEECRDCREPYEDSLVSVCREIKRKVKGVLWT